jgi:hypothetical protein
MRGLSSREWWAVMLGQGFAYALDDAFDGKWILVTLHATIAGVALLCLLRGRA